MNNLSKRIIPCLDINGGRVVKGVNFVDLKDAGDPVEIAKRYSIEGADELTFLDISASVENRATIIDLVEKVVSKIDIPLTVGGGIRSLEDAKRLFDVGCSKVSINSSAVSNPDLIDEISSNFSSQKLVVAIDVKKVENDQYNVFVKGGKEDTGLEAISWAKEVEKRGAGEILLTSMDADGVKQGYDLEITGKIAKAVNIPVVASGGAGNMQDFKDAFNCGASAALAASIFHFKEVDIKELKEYLKNNGIKVNI